MKTITAIFLFSVFSIIAHAETYGYDTAGRLIEVLYDDGSRLTYTYDKNGNRLSVAATGGDSDNDGMPDWWEESHGLSPSSSSALDGPDGDRDGDGVRNFDEWLADTDPNDRDSRLRINSTGLDPGGFAIAVDSSPTRFYTLEFSPDLETPFIPIETKQGTGGELTFHDHTPPDGRGFYRIAVATLAP